MISATMARTRRDLQLAKISYATFSFLVDVPISSMRLALIGQTNFSGPLEAHYSEVASKCRRFVEALEPLQFHDWGALKKLIEDGREPSEIREWMSKMFGEPGK